MEESTGYICQNALGRARQNAAENRTKSKSNEKETCRVMHREINVTVNQPLSQGFPVEKGKSPVILKKPPGNY